MKNRKLIRMIAITVTTTVLATTVIPQGTVLGAQNDPVTEETAETVESVQASEVSESEVSKAEIQIETESDTETKVSTEMETETEAEDSIGTNSEAETEDDTEVEVETELETEQIELESSDIPQIGSKITKNTVDCETKEKKSTDWELVWSDEFNEDALDLTKWDYQSGDGSDYGVAGWGNAEKEYYTKGENISFEDGHLVITARKENRGSSTYTSAKLWTKGNDYYNGIAKEPLYAKKYGRIEAKMSLPEGTGYWPAFWMMPLDDAYGVWASSGEIDIMEARGRVTGSVDGTIHFGNSWPNNKSRGGHYDTTIDPSFNFTQEHEYALEWTPGKISWFVDDQCYKTITNWYSIGSDNKENFTYPAPFDQEFFIMLNLAVGGNYDGGNLDDIDGGQMKVDYVRVYDLLDEDGSIHDYSKDEKTVESEAAQAGGLEGGVVGETNFLSGDLTKARKITEHAEGIEGWYLQNGTGGAANVTAAEGGAKVSISSAGENGYSVQLMHQFPLTYGYEYELKFDAKADEARSITAQAGDFTYNFLGSWTKYSDAFTVPLTTEWKTYTYKFDMKEFNDDYARLELNLGLTSTAGVYIRNASLIATGLYQGITESGDKEPTKGGEHIYNGTFDQGNNKDAGGAYTRLKFWNVKGNAAASVDAQRKLVLGSGTDENAGIEQVGVSLLGKDRYELSFDAAALSGNSIGVLVKGTNGTEYISKTVDLTSDMQKKTVSFTVPENVSDKTGSVSFIVGNAGKKILLDNISLKRLTNYNVDYSQIKVYPIENGDFAGCSGSDLKGWSTYGNLAVDVTDGVCTVTAVPSGNVWDKMLIADAMQMEEGMTYELHFEQKAERAGETYTAKIETTDGSYTVITEKQCKTTTDWTNEDITFTCNSSGMMEFKYLLAQVSGECKISFRNVRLGVANTPILQMPFFYKNGVAKADQDIVFRMHPASGTENAWKAAEKTVTVDGKQVQAVFDDVASTMTIPAGTISEEGKYKIKIAVPGFDLCEFNLEVFPAGKNLILNGNFSKGTASWADSYFNEGEGYPAGSLSVTDSKEAKIEYKWAQNFWDLQLIQKKIPVKKGVEYKITFDARATVDRPISLQIAGALTTYKLGSRYHKYTRYFTAPENNAELAFMLGNVTMNSLTTPSDVHAVYFDNICIEEMDDQDELTRIPEVESAGSVKLTQDAVLNLTGVRNAWSAADKTVYVNGTAVGKEDVTFGADKITIAGSVFHQTGNYEVVIKADGFADTNLAFLQITSAGIQEYITNGNFTEGGKNWKFWAGGEPESASIRYAGGQAEINMLYPWKNQFGVYDSWGIQLSQNVFVSKDAEYVLKFKVKSELDKKLDIDVSGQKFSFDMTGKEQEFTCQFKANDEKVAIGFFFGACDENTPENTKMWLRDVSLTRVGDEEIDDMCVYQIEHYIQKDGKYVLYEKTQGAAKKDTQVNAQQDGLCRNYEGYTYAPGVNGSVGIGIASDKLVMKLFYKANKYQIDYVLNFDGEVENPNPDSYLYGQTLQLKQPSCKERVFLGWYFDEDYSALAETITPNMTGNLVLYAKWKEAEDPGTENPDTETPDTEKPDTEKLGTETPDTENPDTEKPDTEKPDTEKPGTKTPDTEKPGTETPDTEKPGTQEPGTVAVTQISLNKSKVTLNKGKKFTLTAKITPENATNKNVVFSSDNKKVATVNEKGIIEAVGKGKTKITVKTVDGKKKAVCTVIVIIPAKKVTMNVKDIYVVKGKKVSFKATMNPIDSTDKLKWDSSKKSVATVKNGKVTAKKTGTAVITASTTSGKKVTCKIHVVKRAKKSTAVTLNKKQLTMKTGGICLLKAKMKPFDSTDIIKWKSSNKKIATVDQFGTVKAKKAGKVKITAMTSSGKKVTCVIEVKKK